MDLTVVPDSTESVTHFSEAAEYTGVRDRRDAGGDPDPEWLEIRRTLITASDMAAILGENPRRCALDVWLDKTTELREPEVIDIHDPRFWGAKLEQPILEIAAEYHGWRYQRGGYLLRSRACPIIGATLDAEIDRNDGLGWLDYEGKTTRIPSGWDEETQDLPMHVLVQAQTQLFVTRAPLAVVFALLQGSRPVCIEVEPSPEFHEALVEHAEWFLDLVRRLVPPPPDDSLASRRALERMYADCDGSAVPLPREAVDWTREYQGLAEWRRAIESRRLELGNMLRAHIGHATHGLLPEPVGGKSCWRWRKNKHGQTRVLTPLKHAPTGLRALPPVEVPQLADILERSVEHFSHSSIKRTRRKARR